MGTASTTDIQTLATHSVASFFAALRSGFDIGGEQGKLFSGLLAQAEAMEQNSQRNRRFEANEPVSGDVAPADKTYQNEPSADDREALRALLRQIKQDVEALREVRQAEHLEAKTEETSRGASNENIATGSSGKTCSEEVDDVEASSAETVATTDGAEEEAQMTEAVDNTIEGVGDEQVVADASQVVAETVTTVLAAPVERATARTEGEVGVESSSEREEDILSDLMETEYAAILLLNKMLEDRSKAVQAVVGTDVQVDVVAAPSNENVRETEGSGIEIAAAMFASFAQRGSGRQGRQEISAPTEEAATASDDALQKDLTPAASIDSALIAKTTAKGTGENAEHGTEFFDLFKNQTLQPANPHGASSLASMVREAVAAKASSSGEHGVEAVSSSSGTTATTTTQASAETARPLGTYDFASQLSATRATKGGTTGLPSVVEQVAVQIHKCVKAGNTEITLQLRPAELGRIEIKLEFTTDNKVQGTVVADNQATLDLLSKDVGSLQRALQDAGLRADAESLQFSLRSDGQSMGSFGQSMNNGGQSDMSASGQPDAESTVGEGVAATDDVETYYIAPGRVNLQV